MNGSIGLISEEPPAGTRKKEVWDSATVAGETTGGKWPRESEDHEVACLEEGAGRQESPLLLPSPSIPNSVGKSC